jgi:hypothetical protein
MWTAITVVAIALIGTAFMVWFLVALLRECASSVFCWDVTASWKAEKNGHLTGARRIYAGETTARVAESHGGYGYPESLEKEVYAKECASGLIALDVRHVGGRVGWRSIQL